jgi:hypothetical protein
VVCYKRIDNSVEMLSPNDSLLRQPLNLLTVSVRWLLITLVVSIYIQDARCHTMAECPSRCFCKRWRMALDFWVSFDTPERGGRYVCRMVVKVPESCVVITYVARVWSPLLMQSGMG